MLKTGPEKRKTWRCVAENDSAARRLAPQREGAIRPGQLKAADEHSLCCWHVNPFWAKKNKPCNLSEEKQSPTTRFRK
jgi:hypothetical protein